MSVILLLLEEKELSDPYIHVALHIRSLELFIRLVLWLYLCCFIFESGKIYLKIIILTVAYLKRFMFTIYVIYI